MSSCEMKMEQTVWIKNDMVDHQVFQDPAELRVYMWILLRAGAGSRGTVLLLLNGTSSEAAEPSLCFCCASVKFRNKKYFSTIF